MYPAVMDRAITMLKTLEVKPYLTNDNIPVDIFKVIFGFTDKLLRSHPYEMSPRQLARYVRALEDYDDASTAHESCQDKNHVKRKKTFLSQLRKENMLKRLSKLVERRMNPNALQLAGSGDEGGLKRKREPRLHDSASQRSAQSGGRNSCRRRMDRVFAGVYREANTSTPPLVIDEASQEDKAFIEVESLTLQGPTTKPNIVVQDSEDGK